VQGNVDCSDYSFTNCSSGEIETSDNKVVEMTQCLSDDHSKLCFFFTGEEYRDVEGNTFDETCVTGFNRKQ